MLFKHMTIPRRYITTLTLNSPKPVSWLPMRKCAAVAVPEMEAVAVTTYRLE